MKIGIITSGGDCPGINATIRGVGKTAINHYGMEVIGIRGGFHGVLTGDIVTLDDKALSGILNLGGTILGTSREKELRMKLKSNEDNMRDKYIRMYNNLGLDCLVCIGGNGTMKTANVVSEIGLNVVALPKTIDNDIYGTDLTFGFDTAVDIATDAIDRLHSTAESHKRVMVIEVMGHDAGWIALHAGMAGGGDVILLPEFGYNIDVINAHILDRCAAGKHSSIVVVGEGIKTPRGSKAAEYIAQAINIGTGLETRETILGYIQRGGNPSAFDRNLGTMLGSFAAELIETKQFGLMVSYLYGKTTAVPLSEVSGKLKLITRDNPLILCGERIGICFGF